MVIGRVYKICTDEKYTDEIYIGSTFDTLKNRFVNHKTNLCSSSILFEKYGYENCHIELIKEYDVLDREHLETYETLWICKYRNKCVNQCVPFYIKKLWEKAYYEVNRDAILERNKVYHEANKDAISKRMKVYREANKDKISKQQKQPWFCKICNVTIRIGKKARHLKTKRHQDNLSREQ